MKLWANVPGLCIQDQRDRGRMFRRVAKEDPDLASIFPLIMRLLCLQGILKYVDWASERMQVAQVRFDLRAHEL